jgi:predicted Zn-dependent protease
MVMNPKHILRGLRISGVALFAALAPAHAETTPDLVPDDLPASLSGSYLAARSADLAHDITAALDYFGQASELDPGNPEIAERLLVLQLANGNLGQAMSSAVALVADDNGSPIGRLTLAVQAIGTGRYKDAIAEFDQSAKAPLANLTGGLLSAWAQYGQGDVDGALARIDDLIGPNWYQIF